MDRNDGDSTSEMSVVHVLWHQALAAHDDRELSGYAHNIWFGMVEEDLGPVEVLWEDEGDHPPLRHVYTEFRVRVQEVLKGNIDGSRIVIRQPGGRGSDGYLRIVNEDPLLEVSSVYLFATRMFAPEGPSGALEEAPQTAAGFGNVRVRDAEHWGELRRRFQEAIRNERPWPHERK